MEPLFEIISILLLTGLILSPIFIARQTVPNRLMIYSVSAILSTAVIALTLGGGPITLTISFWNITGTILTP